jgi:hypothetical protein
MARGAQRAAAGAAAALPLALLLCLASLRAAAGQASQGASLAAIQAALKPQGWLAVDPGADACASPGTNTPGVLCSGSTVTEM